jgi:hypothetical protein
MVTMRTVIVLAAVLLSSGVSVGQGYQAEMAEKLKEISTACEDQAVILADARFNKWRKARPDQSSQLTPETYQAVRKTMHTQCVSVQHVSLLRLVKSHITAQDAARMNVDGEIERLMVIIERTL